MLRKVMGFTFFIATGGALIILSVAKTADPVLNGLFLLIGVFYVLGLTEHYKDIKK